MYNIYIFSIDKNELRNYVTNTERLPSSTYEKLTNEVLYNDYRANRIDRNKYASYGTVAFSSNGIDEKSLIHTNSLEETNRYLETAVHLFKDSNPQIIRRTMVESPTTYEQRIRVRYLQPPEVPPPGVMKHMFTNTILVIFI